jgi:hypothetical protein
MKTSDVAVPVYFECKEVEAQGEFSRVNVVAEVCLSRKNIVRINTDAIRMGVVAAVRANTEFEDGKNKEGEQ